MRAFKERCVFKNGPNSVQTVNSLLFSREIVRIERLPLRSGRRDSSKRAFSGSYKKTVRTFYFNISEGLFLLCSFSYLITLHVKCSLDFSFLLLLRKPPLANKRIQFIGFNIPYIHTVNKPGRAYVGIIVSKLQLVNISKFSRFQSKNIFLSRRKHKLFNTEITQR